MNKDKMKAKCEVWIRGGMGACRAPVTYDELYSVLTAMEEYKAIIAKTESRLYAMEGR